MTSNRLILIFLGIIFLIIVILSSSRIAGFLRSRFGKYIPVIGPLTLQTTPSPTPIAEPTVVSPTITPITFKTINQTGTVVSTSGEIPATGPNELVWLILGGSLLGGFSIRKISSTSRG